MTLTPSCSTCGLAVEWLRSCYQSEWKLLTGEGAPATPGRYYFCLPGTPFYPARTRVGSRGWYDKNAMIVQGLGELLTFKQVWDNGEPPPILPEFVMVGDPECIADGEAASEALNAGELIAGYPPECYVAHPQTNDPWPVMSDYSSCSIQLAAAKIIEWVYNGDNARIVDLLSGMLGPTYTITHNEASGSFPGNTIAVSDVGTFVFESGTGSFQQFALQAGYALLPPDNIGIFGTLQAWYLASTNLHFQLLTAGANPTGPIFFAGHSYGGVLCCILAARYRAANADRQIRFITYGCPKVGDARLVELLRSCRGLALANDFDIVPTVPPGPLLVAALVAVGLPGILASWNPWLTGPFTQSMDTVGTLTPDANPTLDFVTAFGIALYILDAVDYPFVPEHAIDEYFKRVLIRCPLPEWPLTAADYAKIFAV